MTSKPLHVRLEVMVDGEHPERCGVCQKLSVYMTTRGARCAEFGDLEWWATQLRPERHTRCISATTADALNAAVVEAAKTWRYTDFDAEAPERLALLDDLSEAVDALRSAERKKKR